MVAQFLVLHLTFEGEHNVVSSHGNTVTPLGVLVHLDGQLGEVWLRVLHAVSKPHHWLVSIDGVVRQWLPQQRIAVLVRVPD